MKKRSLTNFCIGLLFLICLTGCFVRPRMVLSDSAAKGLFTIQPIQVLYVSQDGSSNMQFEVYVEKLDLGHRIFGIHPLFGRIFVVRQEQGEVQFEEDLGKVDKLILIELFAVLEDRDFNCKAPRCEFKNGLTTGESLNIVVRGGF